MGIIIFTALALSMDAFSVSLSIGTLDLRKNKIIVLAAIVGLFHFIMPLLGFFIGHLLFSHLIVLQKYFLSIVFIYIGIQMLRCKENESQFNIMSIFGIFLFAISVSLDSFTIGMAYGVKKIWFTLYFLLFALFSGAFTFAGLVIGKYSNRLFGLYATRFGGIMLLSLGIINLF